MKIFKYVQLPYFVNMAMDEWLMGKGEFLRIYGWDTPTLSYGRNQRVSSLNLDYCKENNFNYVRRPSGGRAVFHEFELTYSFITYKDKLPDSIFESYKIISAPILNALKKIGVNAKFHRIKILKQYRTSSCFDSPNIYEIAVNGKKIVGSAQWRKKDSVLQHGSILFDWNKEHWAKSHSKYEADKVKNILSKSMITLREIGITMDIEEFADILKSEFKKEFSFQESELPCEDNDLVLLFEKYKSDSWNLIK